MIGDDAADAAPTPSALVARTTHEYAFFVFSPPTLIGVAAAPGSDADRVAPPLRELHVALKLMIAAPLSGPAVYDTVNEPVLAVVTFDTAFTPVGAPGGKNDCCTTVVVVGGSVVVVGGKVVEVVEVVVVEVVVEVVVDEVVVVGNGFGSVSTSDSSMVASPVGFAFVR